MRIWCCSRKTSTKTPIQTTRCYGCQYFLTETQTRWGTCVLGVDELASCASGWRRRRWESERWHDDGKLLRWYRCDMIDRRSSKMKMHDDRMITIDAWNLYCDGVPDICVYFAYDLCCHRSNFHCHIRKPAHWGMTLQPHMCVSYCCPCEHWSSSYRRVVFSVWLSVEWSGDHDPSWPTSRSCAVYGAFLFVCIDVLWTKECGRVPLMCRWRST